MQEKKKGELTGGHVARLHDESSLPHDSRTPHHRCRRVDVAEALEKRGEAVAESDSLTAVQVNSNLGDCKGRVIPLLRLNEVPLEGTFGHKRNDLPHGVELVLRIVGTRSLLSEDAEGSGP